MGDFRMQYLLELQIWIALEVEELLRKHQPSGCLPSRYSWRDAFQFVQAV